MISEHITELYLPYPGKGDRLVRVYVPAHEEGELFPVIYMTDGQNVLDEAASDYGCWHTPEAVAAERAESGRAAIIVGIHSAPTPLERAKELTPKSIGTLQAPAQVLRELIPEGEIFDGFVTQVVIPAVEDRFPAMRERSARAFCGSSSGGLEAFFIVLSHPDLFCAGGVFSPAFMPYTMENIAAWVRSVMCVNSPYLYLYSGGEGELEQVICRCTEAVYDILSECCDPEKFSEVILPDQPHHESAWEMIFREFLHLFLLRREEF